MPTEFCLGARSENFRPLLGHGIFTEDGKAWKSSRDLLRPQFMQTPSKSFPAIQEEIEKFIHSVKARTEEITDLQPCFLDLPFTQQWLFSSENLLMTCRHRGRVMKLYLHKPLITLSISLLSAAVWEISFGLLEARNSASPAKWSTTSSMLSLHMQWKSRRNPR